MDKNSLLKKALIIFIFFAYVAFGIAFIGKQSVKIDGDRWFVLFDDAMISMKYARNLAEGHGLLWNPGEEKVEGFTNLLWTLYMAVPHALGLPDSKTSLFIMLTGLICMVFTMIMLLKIAEILDRDNFALKAGALFLTAFSLSNNYWYLYGMESCVIGLLLTVMVYLTLVQMETGRFNPFIYIIGGVMTLIRIDTAVLLLCLFVIMAITEKGRALRHLKWLGITLFIFLGGQTFFRVFYYGELLPNTYYLKMTGYPALLRITRGIFVIIENMYYMNWIIFAAPFLIALRERNRVLGVILAFFSAQVLYGMYVGGDVWENWGGPNRYYVTAMPVFTLAIAYSALKVSGYLAGAFKGKKDTAAGWAYLAVLILVFVNINSLKGLYRLKELFFMESTLYREEFLKDVKVGLFIKNVTDEKAVLAVTSAGIVPYVSRRNCIDYLGKSNITVARENAMLPPDRLEFEDKLIFYVPGHYKHGNYLIRSRMPDISFPTPYKDEKFMKEHYIFDRGINCWFLKNSPKIKWEEFKKLRPTRDF